MVDIIHRIGIKSPAVHVRDALTSLDGLANWWTAFVSMRRPEREGLHLVT